MRSNGLQYPYPFLAEGRDDYINSDFQIEELQHEESTGSFQFKFCCKLSCPGIECMIERGEASVVINISSPSTMFRKTVPAKLGEINVIEIKKETVAKRVVFKAEIISEGSKAFSLPEHNADLYGAQASFSLRKGDVLAESSTITVKLDDSDLKRPFASIFLIDNTTETLPEGIRIVLDDEKIHVVLPEESYRKYDMVKAGYPTLRRTLNAIVTLPALVDAVTEVVEAGEDSDYRNRRWFSVLENRIAQVGIDDAEGISPVQIANRIYESITNDGLSRLHETISELARTNEDDYRSVD